MNDAYTRLTDYWLSTLRESADVKQKEFGKYAEEISCFYDSDSNWYWSDSERFTQAGKDAGWLEKQKSLLPVFGVTVNPLSDYVRLFIPSLAHRNPTVTVTPRRYDFPPFPAFGFDPNDPASHAQYAEMQQQFEYERLAREAGAANLQTYHDWLNSEDDILEQQRLMLPDTLLTGIGFMETSFHRPFMSQWRYPAARHISWRDVLMDPDAKYRKDIYWVAIRRRAPVNIAEEIFRLPPGYLKGKFFSAGLKGVQSMNDRTLSLDDKFRAKGVTHDICEWWDVYSKNGIGQHLKAFDNTVRLGITQEYDPYEVHGRHSYIAVMDGLPHPLNLPPWVTESGDIPLLRDKTSWPIVTQSLNEGWPVDWEYFYPKSGSIWPIAPPKAVIGLVEFCNWCMSYMAEHAAQSAKSYHLVVSSFADDIQKQLADGSAPNNIIAVADRLLVDNKPLSHLVHTLQSRDFGEALMKVYLQSVNEIQKNLGTNELMYASPSRAMRSAQEANVLQSQMMIRPDDMAQCHEQMMSRVARARLQACRELDVKEIEAAIGPYGAMVWQQQIQGRPLDYVARDFEYIVAAGSGRKPNYDQKLANFTDMANTFGPAVIAAAGQGNPQPYNAMVQQWGKLANEDVSGMIMTPPPQPAMAQAV